MLCQFVKPVMPDTFNKSTHYFAKNEVRLRSHFCVNCCFPVWPWLLLRRFNLSNIGDCVREGQVMLKITLTLTYTRPPMFDRLERRNNSYSVPVSRVISGTGSRCSQRRRQSLASRGPKRVLRGHVVSVEPETPKAWSSRRCGSRCRRR